jgi:hypothetical protein
MPVINKQELSLVGKETKDTDNYCICSGLKSRGHEMEQVLPHYTATY